MIPSGGCLALEAEDNETQTEWQSWRSEQTGGRGYLAWSEVTRGFPGGSVVKNPPAMQETHLPTLGQEEPLEKGMATHSSVLPWEMPRTEEPGGLQSTESRGVRTEHTHLKLLEAQGQRAARPRGQIQAF